MKLGIRWNDSYYANLAVSFGWMYGSVAFQILSDAVAHIVAMTGVKLHCYIKVVPKVKADEKFRDVCDLLNELVLPLNCDKLILPPKALYV